MNFIISILLSSIAVVILVVIPWVGVGVFDLHLLFGVILPYLALAVFFVGMIARAQDGADQHVGKVPQRAGETMKKQNGILRLRSELKRAVQKEDYEQAANLRDQIKKMEDK